MTLKGRMFGCVSLWEILGWSEIYKASEKESREAEKFWKKLAWRGLLDCQKKR